MRQLIFEKNELLGSSFLTLVSSDSYSHIVTIIDKIFKESNLNRMNKSNVDSNNFEIFLKDRNLKETQCIVTPILTNSVNLILYLELESENNNNYSIDPRNV
jgi:hypothetical protein